VPPPGAPANYRAQKDYRWKQNRLYYRGKPCVKVKPPTPVRSKAAGDDINRRVEQIYNDCTEREEAPGPQASCIRDKEEEYGKELARLYQNLLKDKKIDVAVLRESQRNWLGYQKQTCRLYELKAASEWGVTAAGRRELALCLLRTTLERIQELHDLMTEPP
jgi:uncharacterized protein YecT (DUF1311 family)